jgi:class 3 adenylate cyclase/predicted ATPase
VFRRCCWHAEGQKNIFFHKGLPLLGAEDHRMDVVAWLRALGLEQYAPAFRDNDVDGEVLPALTSDDLISIGVTSVGHRRKLLAAIASLAAPPAGTVMEAPRDAPATADAERRQLTVMFCDLVGSTKLSSRLDPEDLREVIGTYHRAVAEIVRGFEGFVAKYMGDGVLAYFGYPAAHEDDAERAVRAGLGVIDAVGRLDVKAIKLQARVGLATGLSVVGDLIGEGSAQEQAVVGETPNLAARLQALAGPNSLVIAENTRRQIGAFFDLDDLGPQPLAGFTEPQRAWRVVRESTVVSRFEALRGTALTPFVGREEEIELLLRRWQRAIAGEGQVVLLNGEAGIGKSRLVGALHDRLAEQAHTRLRYFCSPYHEDSALHPFIAQLQHAAGFVREDAAETRLDKLEALLAPGSPSLEDLALFAGLLSLPAEPRYPPLGLSPQRKKDKTFEALLRQLAALAQRQPVLFVCEDLHWVDPSSRELLDRTIERAASLPVLLVLTHRLEFVPPWSGLPQVTTMTLSRFDRRAGAALFERIAGDATLASDVAAEIVDRADGVPLFVEELTKAVIEAGGAGEGVEKTLAGALSSSLAVPSALHTPLMARLDRLGPIAKEIAQVGAVIGRDFSYELLAAAAQRTETELRDAVIRLVDAGLVFQRGVLPEATFLFKHALVQDTAYSMLLRGPRQALLARIARAIEGRFPAVADTQPEILAHHFTGARLPEKGVVYWCRAGQQSAAKSALVEAITQLRRGLRLIADLPDTRERKQQELDIQVTLAGALMGTKGYAHPEVAEVFGRARSLAMETDAAGTILHFSVLYGLWVADLLRGKPKAALKQAKECLCLAQSQTGSGPLLLGHRLMGTALIALGDYPAALAHLEQAVALYAPEDHQPLAFRFGTDIGICALCVWPWALWHGGYPDQASKAAHAALERSRQFFHLPTLVYALVVIGLTAISVRMVDEMEELASEAVALAREHGFEMYLGWGQIFQGWAMGQRGEPGAAVKRMREGLVTTRATGMRDGYELIFLGLLAEAFALGGEIGEGLEVLAQALATAEGSGARGHDAELHRLRGDLLGRLPSPDWTEVETCFRTGLAIAREQGTRGFELRTAVSLARLLRDRERHDEARDLLAPVYGWFTEGFDTPDLKEAKALLGELA